MFECVQKEKWTSYIERKKEKTRTVGQNSVKEEIPNGTLGYP